jgi:hypothetical protein
VQCGVRGRVWGEAGSPSAISTDPLYPLSFQPLTLTLFRFPFSFSLSPQAVDLKRDSAVRRQLQHGRAKSFTVIGLRGLLQYDVL